MLNHKILKKKLKHSVESAKKSGDYNNPPDWIIQEGVLLSYKEAEYISSILGGELNHLENVTRVEVIDQDGRSYVNWNKDNKTSTSLQDDGRTLKVFIDKNG